VSGFTKEELAIGERLFDLQPDSPWTAFCELRALFGPMSLERRQELYDVVAKRREVLDEPIWMLDRAGYSTTRQRHATGSFLPIRVQMQTYRVRDLARRSQ
jgi:hypothetical protein